MTTKTAKNSGFISCQRCHLLSLTIPASVSTHQICPRCHSILYSRRPHSLEKTWALVIAACILYLPANMLPVMNVVLMGSGQTDTIISGVLHLIKGGMWPLALIVFVASLVVPMLKLSILIGLLVSIQFRSLWRPKDRARLYRLTELIGRWSMVDIFVIAILVALVKFGSLADIEPGAGALSFAAVVVLTMFAARTFDPRLIWDALEPSPSQTITTQK